MFETCRAKPRTTRMAKESLDARMKHYMDEIGQHMHGTIHDWTPPLHPLEIDTLHPKRLGGVSEGAGARDVQHVYCRRRLSSTRAILHDVMYVSRVHSGASETPAARHYRRTVAPKVQSRLVTGHPDATLAPATDFEDEDDEYAGRSVGDVDLDRIMNTPPQPVSTTTNTSTA